MTAEVLGEGRGDKILVFHLKRKKQYKKMQGHRQNFTEVRIKAIEADGVTYTAATSAKCRHQASRRDWVGLKRFRRGFSNGT